MDKIMISFVTKKKVAHALTSFMVNDACMSSSPFKTNLFLEIGHCCSDCSDRKNDWGPRPSQDEHGIRNSHFPSGCLLGTSYHFYHQENDGWNPAVCCRGSWKTEGKASKKPRTKKVLLYKRQNCKTWKINGNFTKNVPVCQEAAKEKKRSDYLLYQMLPKDVATALKNQQTVDPRYYDDVTVYFSDIVGFTDISSSSSPIQVHVYYRQAYWINSLIFPLNACLFDCLGARMRRRCSHNLCPFAFVQSGCGLAEQPLQSVWWCHRQVSNPFHSHFWCWGFPIVLSV